MYKLRELQPLIINWAAEKDLLRPENASKQRLKLIEEVGGIASAILRNNVEGIKDGIGDVYVVLVILAKQLQQPLELKIDEDKSYWDTLELSDFISIVLYNDVFIDFTCLDAFCDRLKVNLEECANLAWDEIKNRTGKTVDGDIYKKLIYV